VQILLASHGPNGKIEASALALVCSKSQPHLAHSLATFPRRWPLVLGAPLAMSFLVELFLTTQSPVFESDLDVNGPSCRILEIGFFLAHVLLWMGHGRSRGRGRHGDLAALGQGSKSHRRSWTFWAGDFRGAARWWR
jgi:hypothetical protein